MRRFVVVALLALAPSCGGLIGIQELHADGALAADGGSGGAPDGDGAPVDAATLGPWCSANATAATFCDDFSGPALTSGWRIEVSARGGTGTLDPDVNQSPPSAFKVLVDPTDSEGAGFALMRDFPAATTRSTFAFDVRVDDLQAGKTSVTLTLARLTFASGYALDLVLRSDGAVLVERPAGTAGAVEHPLKAKLTAMTWSRIEIDVLATGSVGLQLAGADALGASFSSASSASGTVTLRLGAPSAAGGSATRIAHFDDVVVDVF